MGETGEEAGLGGREGESDVCAIGTAGEEVEGLGFRVYGFGFRV